jgi:hypothetical protein
VKRRGGGLGNEQLEIWALGEVLWAARRTSCPVPYRLCKLTRYLQDVVQSEGRDQRVQGKLCLASFWVGPKPLRFLHNTIGMQFLDFWCINLSLHHFNVLPSQISSRGLAVHLPLRTLHHVSPKGIDMRA